MGTKVVFIKGIPVNKSIWVLLFLLMTFIFCHPVYAGWYKDLDGVYNDLREVGDKIEKKEYQKARKMLDEIKVKMEWEKTYGLLYPNSVRNSVKYLDNLIEDKLGNLEKTYFSFTGKIIEFYPGASSGMIVVQSNNSKEEFSFDAGIIEETSKCEWGVGKMVKIYYDIGFNSSKINKIVCLK